MKFRILLFFCFFGATWALIAQDQDLNAWTRVALKYDLSKKARFAVENEMRFFDNASRLSQYHTELGVNYDLNDKWEGGVYYRFIYETDPEKQYELGHRAWLQLGYNWSKDRLSATIRTRLQTTYSGINTRENGRIPESYSRNKISLSYDLSNSKWEPNLGAEFWYQLGSGSERIIDKYRVGGGFEYRYSRNVRIDIFYNYQSQIQVASPNIDHIFGLSYTYLIR